MERGKEKKGEGTRAAILYGSEGTEITARDTSRDQCLLATGGQNTQSSQSEHPNPFATKPEPHHPDQTTTLFTAASTSALSTSGPAISAL